MYKNIIIKFLNNTPTFQTPDPSTWGEELYGFLKPAF